MFGSYSYTEKSECWDFQLTINSHRKLSLQLPYNVRSLVILSEPLNSLAMTLHRFHSNSVRFVLRLSSIVQTKLPNSRHCVLQTPLTVVAMLPTSLSSVSPSLLCSPRSPSSVSCLRLAVAISAACRLRHLVRRFWNQTCAATRY